MGDLNIAFPDTQSFASMPLANENLSKQQEFEGTRVQYDTNENASLVCTAATTDSVVLIESKQDTRGSRHECHSRLQ